MSTVKPAGFHEHHRQKRRSGDERPVNKLFVPPILHDWIEKHPTEAMELGWTVSQHEDPAEVVVVIPDKIVVGPEKKERKPSEATRKKKVFSIRVPDDAENGAEILDTLVQECRESVQNVLGFDGDVPTYFVLVAVLHDWLTDGSGSSVASVPRREKGVEGE